MASDSALLARLATVKNARDLAQAAPPGTLAPHTILRAACPAGCDPSDVDLLVRTLGIRTLMDLRSSTERDADPPGCLLMPFTTGQGGGEASTLVSGTTPRLISIPIIEPRPFKRALISSLPFLTALHVAALSLCGRRGAAKRAAVGALNDGGLPGLYRVMPLEGRDGEGGRAAKGRGKCGSRARGAWSAGSRAPRRAPVPPAGGRAQLERRPAT
jgi:hypothetical protein